MKSTKQPKDRRMRGFERAGGLMSTQIRKAGETRGFAETRLLTGWSEIAGQDIASISRPVNVTYSRGGFGATLVLLTNGSNAPILQAQTPKIKERVNACYGYNAISHIRVTQTAAIGFSEGKVDFEHAPKAPVADSAPTEKQRTAAREKLDGIHSQELADALETLGANILSKPK